jgi:hypothetical protein
VLNELLFYAGLTMMKSSLCALALLIGSTAELSVAQSDRPTVFPIDERPEGITEGPGSTVFVGQILSGRVLSIDVLTGDTNEVVPPQTGRNAIGLTYIDGYVIVAGGGAPLGGAAEVYVYESSSGDTLAACAPLSLNPALGGLMNDATIRGRTAYITDSFNAKLMAMDVDAGASGNCDLWEVALPSAFEPEGPEDISANGIVPYANGLLVSHFSDGSVWYVANVERDDTPSFQVVIPDGEAIGGDGIVVLDDKLYVTQNPLNQIGVFQLGLDGNNITASLLGNITSPLYATPATSALYDGYIYTTNALFTTVPDPSAPANDTVVGVVNPYAETATTSEAAHLSQVPVFFVSTMVVLFSAFM